MAEVKYTAEQTKAIETKGASLLVSAAAGSGKTAVLVERIIRQILSGDASIDDFLVVTFTKAAAFEMKEKIIKALYKKLEQDPKNRRISSQLALVSSAAIETTDSFYLRTIREYAAKLDIPPDIAPADNTEIEGLTAEVYETVMERRYQEGRREFLEAIEFFSTSRSDARFLEIVEDIRLALSSYPDPVAFLKKSVEGFDAYKETLVSEAKKYASYGKELMQDARDHMSWDEVIAREYGGAITDYMSLFEQIEGIFSYGEIKRLAESFKASSFGRKTKEADADVKAYVTFRRDEAKKALAEINDILKMSEGEIEQDFLAVRAPMLEIISFIEEVEGLLFEKKLAKRLMDFSDLARLMYRLTIDKDGNKTPEAKRIGGRYKEIFVDEYQDTNTLQDSVFKAISNEEQNLFMVGDVKQSIYRFRKAEPRIFSDKKERFDNHGEGICIPLGSNFRSRKSVIDYVNAVFTAVMSRDVGDVFYDDEALRYASLAYGETQDPESEFHLLVPNEVEEGIGEPEYIAALIQRLLNEQLVSDGQGGLRRLTPRDIAVLCRTKSKVPLIRSEIEAAGIMAYADTGEAFFRRDEVMTSLSLLTVIDNPLSDVELAGIMLSPMFGFSPSELAEIRIIRRDRPFWLNVKKAARKSGKAASFVETIEGFRELAKTISVERLLRHAFDVTGYLSVVAAMEGGALREVNLRVLTEYAAKFENSGFKGLFAFNRYIKRLSDSGREPEGAATAIEGADCVQIMTIHKSKGLEFPVVILCDAAHGYNKNDLVKPVLIHSEVGVGIKLRDIKRMVEFDTAGRSAVKIKIENDNISEEMRCLYVALTRAKEKLIIVGDGRAKNSGLTKEVMPLLKGGKVHPVRVANSRNYADLLLCASYASNLPVKRITPTYEHEDADIISSDELKTIQLSSAIDFVYPYKDEVILPSKLTVTRIADLKREHTEGATIPNYERQRAYRRPNIITGSTAPTGAERGTAIHEILGFCDLTLLSNGVTAEVARLFEGGFITKEQAQSVDTSLLERFTKTQLFTRMMKSDKIDRELRFRALFEASKLLPFVPNVNSKEEILLQGTIDCVFLEGDGYVIVDYKTDRQREGLEEILKEKYTTQLKLYKSAFEEMVNLPVKETVIYSFGLEKEIIV